MSFFLPGSFLRAPGLNPLICSLFFVLTLQSFAIEYPSEDIIVSGRYDISNGLSSNYIRDVLQDSEGYLWLATDNGINRFDGYSTVIYKPEFIKENSFNAISFHCIEEDQAGNLWFGSTRSGVNILNKETQSVRVIDRNTTPGISENAINVITSDSKGRSWIGTVDGLNLYHPDTDEIIIFNTGNRAGKGDPFGTISEVFEDSNNKILIGTWGNGLYIFDEGKGLFSQLLLDSEVLKNDSVNRIVKIQEDSFGNYWLGTWEGGLIKTRLHNYNELEVLEYYSVESKNGFKLSSNIIYSLHEDKDGSIWVGTPYGLHIIRNHTASPEINLLQPDGSEGSVTHNDILSVYEDRSGIIWLATGGGGLNMINPDFRKVKSYTIPEVVGLQKNHVTRSFVKDIDGSLLVGIHGLGFGRYDLAQRTFTRYQDLERFNDLPSNINSATSFHKDSKNNLWIGTRYNALFLVGPDNDLLGHFLFWDEVTTDRSRTINTIFEDRFGQIWAGTSMGLFKFVFSEESNEYQIFRYLAENGNEFTLRGEFISTITEDSDGNIWVGSIGGGISKVKNEENVHFPLQFHNFVSAKGDTNTLRSNIVYSIFEDSQKLIWVGTGTAGLALYNKSENSFTHFFRNVGIREDAVYDILEKNDNLWITTNNGLFRFKLLSDNNFQIENYSSEDGFQSDVFINNASYHCSTGEIFVGGYYGFNVFVPDDLFRNSYIPPMVMSGLWVGDEKINEYQAMENGLVLKHDQTNIRLTFSALSYFQPLKNKYSYKLEGLDDTWNYSDSEGRIISFSHIPPGSYTLLVKGSNSSDLWNETPIALNIRVKPHPLRSLWAYIFYFLGTMIILITIYYFLINSYRIKHAYEIEKLEHKKQDNINQFKFRFFTNISHELLTPLSVLSFSIEDLNNKKKLDDETFSIMDRNVKRIMHLISQLLDFRKVERGSMSPLVSPGNITEFIDKMTLSLKPMAARKNISVFQSGSIEQKIYFDHDKMEKILGNLLSNALKYTPEGGKILMRHDLYEKDAQQWLEMEITDSGKGIEPEKIEKVFDRFYQVKSVTGRTFGVGIGLALAKSLVENHKGIINVRNEAGLGASFSVCIPVSPEAYQENEIMHTDADFQSRNYIIDTDISLLPPPDDLQEEASEKNDDGLKTVLIVEDNADFRTLIRHHMSNYYHTLEAENGEVGYQLCLDKQPDLVITDMMMPVMSGIELCNKIKNNIETSHIIVIMLTAKIDQEARHDSYLANADSYLSKPVDIRTLQTRVESLLNRYDSITQKYTTGIMPSFDENTISTLDEEFLNKIKSLIESKLMNTELNVLSLSQEVGMSKSNLYRKITKLTGMSPVEFIRYIRLQAAAEMIVKEGLNVSEAAYSCGFNDLSYFSKSFKKQFGSSPKKFQQQNDFTIQTSK